MTRVATGASPEGAAALDGSASGVQQRSAPGWGLPLAVLIAGVFMSILDITIVNVAISTIQNEFGATTNDTQWVVTAYALTEGVVVPATAWLGDRFGLSRVYNLALLAFAAGSALCGLAWDLNSLVIFRIVQAIAGGILPVITLSILFRIVPRDRIGAAMGLYGLGVASAPALGPPLGGYLVEYADWRLIFFINLPIGILGVVAAMLVLPRFPRYAGRRFDVLGFVTVAGGLFSLLLATSKGPDWGWSSYPILGLITFGVLSLALFVVIELEVTDPLLDIRIFRYWAYTHSLLLITVLMVVMFGVLFYIPLFLQQVQGLGALDAGLTLLPQALVMAVLMPIVGRIYDRIGPRWPAFIGLTTAAASTYLLHTITIDTSREQVMWILALLGAGLGIAMMPIFTGGIAVIPMTHVNTASAFNNVVQRVSGAIGLPVLTAIFTLQQAQQMAGRADLLPADRAKLLPPDLLPADLRPADTATPNLGPAAPDWMGQYLTYRATGQQVFVGAMDNLFLISTALLALGALGALLLRSGSAPAAAASSTPPQAARSAAAGNGGPVGPDLPPSATATATAMDNGSPVRQADRRVDVEGDAPRRDT
jgi:EmrB/QacA subfamily drug resistance transporter